MTNDEKEVLMKVDEVNSIIVDMESLENKLHKLECELSCWGAQKYQNVPKETVEQLLDRTSALTLYHTDHTIKFLARKLFKLEDRVEYIARLMLMMRWNNEAN